MRLLITVFLLGFCLPIFGDKVHIPQVAPAHETIEKKLDTVPQWTFQEVVNFANEQLKTIGIETPVALPASDFDVPFVSRTACNTYEFDLGVKDFLVGKIKFSKAVWNNKEFFRVGYYAPYSIDVPKRQMFFIYLLNLNTDPSKLRWWSEIVAKYPRLKKERPFLLVNSDGVSLKFTADDSHYQHSEQKETRPSKEEFARIPFSKVFIFKDGNERIQIPVSCL